jgi:hypothetical protein
MNKEDPMHPLHPAMVEASARLRVAELQAVSRPRASGRLPRRRRSRAVRQTTGWFLVNLGMRLALPKPAVRPATR